MAPLPAAATTVDADVPLEQIIEISFGSSLLYLNQPILTEPFSTATYRRVPLRSMLMLGEWLARETVTVMLLVGIPLDTNKTKKEGVVVDEYLGGTIALGATWTPFIWRPWKRADAKTQLGMLLARRFASTAGDSFFPLGIVRVHVASPKGVSMYLGITYDAVASDMTVLYGIGQRF